MGRVLREFETDDDGRHYVSTTIAAIICGVTQQSFNGWRRQVNPPPFDDSRNMVPLFELGEWIRRHQVLKRGRGGAGFPYLPGIDDIYKNSGLSGVPDKESSEMRLKRLQADKLQIELNERAGSLIPAEKITSAWTTIVSRVRTRLLGIPVKIAPLVTGLSDEYTVQERISDAIREALEDLAETGQDVDDDG